MLKAQRREIIKRWNPWHHLSCAPPVLHIRVFQPSVFLPGSSTRWGRPEGGDHRGKCTSRSFQKGPSVWFLLPATAYEMQIWATQGQEIHFTMLMVSSVLLKSYCDPWLGTVGLNYWRSFLESNFISTQYWPDSAWKVNGKTQSDFNERRSRSVLENLMHSLYILSLIPCDPQRKRNNSESPRAKQGSFAAWAGVLLHMQKCPLQHKAQLWHLLINGKYFFVAVPVFQTNSLKQVSFKRTKPKRAQCW